MAIPFKVLPKFNPADRSQPPKFYAQAVNKGSTDLRNLSNKISLISTVSTIDTMATLEALIQVLPGELAEGKSVKLGDFGSFHVTLQSEGAENEEAFTSGNIKKFSIRFRPGKIVKNVLSNAGYKKD